MKSPFAVERLKWFAKLVNVKFSLVKFSYFFELNWKKLKLVKKILGTSSKWSVLFPISHSFCTFCRVKYAFLRSGFHKINYLSSDNYASAFFLISRRQKRTADGSICIFRAPRSADANRTDSWRGDRIRRSWFDGCVRYWSPKTPSFRSGNSHDALWGDRLVLVGFGLELSVLLIVEVGKWEKPLRGNVIRGLRLAVFITILFRETASTFLIFPNYPIQPFTIPRSWFCLLFIFLISAKPFTICPTPLLHYLNNFKRRCCFNYSTFFCPFLL